MDTAGKLSGTGKDSFIFQTTKKVIMRRYLFIFIGIISACFSLYFFACSPLLAFKVKLPGQHLLHVPQKNNNDSTMAPNLQ